MVRLPKAMLSAKDVKARSSLDERFCFANLVRVFGELSSFVIGWINLFANLL